MRFFKDNHERYEYFIKEVGPIVNDCFKGFSLDNVHTGSMDVCLHSEKYPYGIWATPHWEGDSQTPGVVVEADGNSGENIVIPYKVIGDDPWLDACCYVRAVLDFMEISFDQFPKAAERLTDVLKP